MLINLNWPTLEERRTKAKLIMLYRVLNNLVDIPHPLSFANSPYNTRGTHNLTLNQMSARINVYKFSFFPSVVKIWNSLPPDLVNSTSIQIFKSKLDNYTFL